MTVTRDTGPPSKEVALVKFQLGPLQTVVFGVVTLFWLQLHYQVSMDFFWTVAGIVVLRVLQFHYKVKASHGFWLMVAGVAIGYIMYLCGAKPEELAAVFKILVGMRAPQ